MGVMLLLGFYVVTTQKKGMCDYECDDARGGMWLLRHRKYRAWQTLNVTLGILYCCLLNLMMSG